MVDLHSIFCNLRFSSYFSICSPAGSGNIFRIYLIQIFSQILSWLNLDLFLSLEASCVFNFRNLGCGMRFKLFWILDRCNILWLIVDFTILLVGFKLKKRLRFLLLFCCWRKAQQKLEWDVICFGFKKRDWSSCSCFVVDVRHNKSLKLSRFLSFVC